MATEEPSFNVTVTKGNFEVRDYTEMVVTEDIYAYERFFFEKLSSLPCVQEINSIVALSGIKSTTALPI